MVLLSLDISTRKCYLDTSASFWFDVIVRTSDLCDFFSSPFDAHCCHMGTAIKHPIRVKLSLVIFDIQSLMLSAWISKIHMTV